MGEIRPIRGVKSEDSPGSGVGGPPGFLGVLAAAEWRRVVAECAGRLTGEDQGALAGYCGAFAVFRMAYEQVEADGVTVEGDRGQKIKHPAVQIMRDASASMLGWARQLGLTPFARRGERRGDDTGRARRLLPSG